jgi:4'-phosphopantetheinyl transferase
MKSACGEHMDSAIVVWMTQVSKANDSLPFVESCLDPHDRQRAMRFRYPEDRARFVLGRALLRKCLGHQLQLSPDAIELTYTERGRPVFTQDDSVQFSISHTHDWVAVAVTLHAKVGIDLEYVQSKLDLLDLAPRIFSESDLRAFQAFPDEEMTAAFFCAWTRKEAYLKARGEGIAEALQQVSVSFGSTETRSIRDVRDKSGAPAWRHHALPVPDDYVGSVACDDSAKLLECHLVRFSKSDVILTSPSTP